jgi:hypothetical protein
LTRLQGSLAAALDALIEPTCRGTPEVPLRWTCKTVRRLAAEVLPPWATASKATVRTGEGRHPDRNARFEHIAARAEDSQRRGRPVLSVDTKNQELVGDSEDPVREWHPRGHPEEVRVHNFCDRGLGSRVWACRPRNLRLA